MRALCHGQELRSGYERAKAAAAGVRPNNDHPPARLELSGPDGAPVALTATAVRAQFEAAIEAKAARRTDKEQS